jgi:hypothetical protein
MDRFVSLPICPLPVLLVHFSPLSPPLLCVPVLLLSSSQEIFIFYLASWYLTSNKRKFFEKFAEKNEFDPLLPYNWYSQSKEKILAEQVPKNEQTKILAKICTKMNLPCSYLFLGFPNPKKKFGWLNRNEKKSEKRKSEK